MNSVIYPEYQVAEKIEKVIATFQSAQHIAATISRKGLVKKLASYDPEFRSVAYEAAFVSVASADFEEGDGKRSEQWKNFFTTHQSFYEGQLLCGFGWAIAAHQKNPIDFLPEYDPLISMRLLDGYGFYYTLLRSRITVQNLLIPDTIKHEFLFAFDHGTGRGLWYLCKGDLEKLKALLEKFPEERKPDLWRGIGTASAFVGGINAANYIELNQIAEEYANQFAVGVLFAVRSRVQSNCITDCIEIACRALTNFNLYTAFKFTEDCKKKTSDFKEWLSEMLDNIELNE